MSENNTTLLDEEYSIYGSRMFQLERTHHGKWAVVHRDGYFGIFDTFLEAERTPHDGMVVIHACSSRSVHLGEKSGGDQVDFSSRVRIP